MNQVLEALDRVAQLEQEKSELCARNLELTRQLSNLANAGASVLGWLSAELEKSKALLVSQPNKQAQTPPT